MSGYLKTTSDKYVLIATIILFPIMSHAGGHGIAAIVALAGLLTFFGTSPKTLLVDFKRIPTAFWLVMTLIVWGLITSFWSPYESKNILSNPLKLLLGVPAYFGFAFAFAKVAKTNSETLEKYVIAIAFGSVVFLLIDVCTGYGISLTLDPVAPHETPGMRKSDLIQNLGHCTSVLALLFPPVFVLLWRKGSRGRAMSGILLILILVASVLTSTNAATLAVLASIVFMALTYWFPKWGAKIAFGIAGAAILTGPVLGRLVLFPFPEQESRLPFSWEERIESWRYIYSRVLEHPFFGHGFDAVRTFSDTHTIRGFEGRGLVSLHPHNASLHVWTETGFVGISILIIALFFASRHLTQPGALSKSQSTSVSGLVIATTVMMSLSYSVWQHWLWASIIFAASLVCLSGRVKKNSARHRAG